MTPDRDGFGTITPNGEHYDMIYVRRIAASPERVWAAITIPERIAAWFAEVEVEIEPRLGGVYRLRFGPDTPFTDGAITGFEPLRLLQHTWPNPPGPTSVVRYELEPDGDGCMLRLTCTQTPGAYLSSLAGWHLFLDALPPSLDGVRVQWTMDQELALMGHYEALVPWLAKVRAESA